MTVLLYNIILKQLSFDYSIKNFTWPVPNSFIIDNTSQLETYRVCNIHDSTPLEAYINKRMQLTA